ncbi:MAG TPA: tetratricopeptide repeat protein [Thermoanaerobaculia bacterium]|jgi:DNA-binding winged helix-turn-helix (wHTH) protein/tetratricopeptide (TPR) repeat protein
MVLRFGPFELDSEREELRRSGLSLRLPHQPARLLQLFVRRAGEVITREEIQQELWGSDTHVDYEQGINAAIRQIRFHLGDNAEAPRYLKTIPRRGYVFIAPVEAETETDPPGSSEFLGSSGSSEEPVPLPPRNSGEPEELRGTASRTASRRSFAWIAAVIALIAIAAAAYFFYPRNRRTIAVTEFRAIGALPAGVDPRAFTQELRSTVGMLPASSLRLLEESNGDAEIRVEGTIQRAGDSVRVIVSAIDTRSRTQVWTEMYDRRIGEHHNMAMQTAHLVSYEVARRFLPPPRHEPILRTEVPPRVLQTYRQARIELRRSVPDPGGNRAAGLFEQALKDVPKFPEALSGLADIWMARAGALSQRQRGAAVARARGYAQQALALQPDNVEAITVLGVIALQYDWDLTVAEQRLREVVEKDPEYVNGHFNLAMAYTARGELDAALQQYEAARQLDPIAYDLHPVEGMLYLRARRYEEAIARYREILRFRDSAQSRWGILWAASKLEKWDDATSVMRLMLDLPPRPAGEKATREEYVDLFRRLEPLMITLRDRGLYEHYHVAAYYSMRGDSDPAFESLGKALENRSPSLAYLMVDPRFDKIRNDARYAPLVARIR